MTLRKAFFPKPKLYSKVIFTEIFFPTLSPPSFCNYVNIFFIFLFLLEKFLSILILSPIPTYKENIILKHSAPYFFIE